MNFETNEIAVNSARNIAAASGRTYNSTVSIAKLVNEEAARIEAGGYVWENYRDAVRTGSARPVNRATRKAVFDFVCAAVRADFDPALELIMAGGGDVAVMA